MTPGRIRLLLYREKTQGVERRFTFYEDHAGRYDAPGNHDSGIHLRAPNFFSKTLLGFKEEITDERNSSTVAKAASLRDNAFNICSLAKPTFTRSSKQECNRERGMELDACQLVVRLGLKAVCIKAAVGLINAPPLLRLPAGIAFSSQPLQTIYPLGVVLLFFFGWPGKRAHATAGRAREIMLGW